MTVLFDLEGFNMRQYAWKPAAELVFSLLQMYEANYPEILKTCFIINGPTHAELTEHKTIHDNFMTIILYCSSKSILPGVFCDQKVYARVHNIQNTYIR